MLSGVNDVFNAIMVRGDEVGDVMFYGRGAGKFPTASAVVGDVIDCAKHLKARKYLFWEDPCEPFVTDSSKDIAKLYVRIKTKNTKDLCEKLVEKFGDISYIKNDAENEVVFLTENDIEEVLLCKLEALRGIESIRTLHVID